MKEFLVWSEDGDREDAHTVFAWTKTHAAEQYMDANHANFDYSDEAQLWVELPTEAGGDGIPVIYDMKGESSITWSATRREPAK